MKEEIISVGIDIGTSTTQLVFSKMIVENTASSFSIPRVNIVDKNILYQSNIYFTPLISSSEIDGPEVKKIIEKEYGLAGFKKEEIGTGAVIITGETARKENAGNVLNTLSGFAGEFVVATAGPDLESIIAGRGSGADILSKEKSASVVNIDIGGGTTNLAVFSDGDVIDTGCLDIGGRLIKIDRVSKKVTYVAPKIKILANKLGLSIEEDKEYKKEDIEVVVNALAELILESVGYSERSPIYKDFITNKTIKASYDFDYITFSGGVADYIYNSNEDDFLKYGDIGILLGRAIKKAFDKQQTKVIRPAETIRATVVGAASHTTEISGSTITYDPKMLPIKNLPILKLTKDDENNGYKHLADSIADKIRWFDLENEVQQIALSIKGKDRPSFKDIQDLADSIITGMDEYLKHDFPIFVIIENDIAKVLGQTLNAKLKHSHSVVCIDSIEVQNGDYIDIGSPIVNGRVVPVVIKTLVLNS